MGKKSNATVDLPDQRKGFFLLAPFPGTMIVGVVDWPNLRVDKRRCDVFIYGSAYADEVATAAMVWNLRILDY
jgi:hypothetical protein